MKKIAFRELLASPNKPVADAAVQAVIKKAGKVKLSSDFIVALEADFDTCSSAGARSGQRAAWSTTS